MRVRRSFDPLIIQHLDSGQGSIRPLDCFLDVSAGGGTSNQSSAFSRAGTSQKDGTIGIPQYLSDLIDQSNSAVSLGGTDSHNNFISGLLTRDNTFVPNSSGPTQVANTSASSVPWYGSMVDTASTNPFSSTYEADTQDAYMMRLQNALATLDSSTIRGGEQHGALVKGQAIADANRQRSEDLAKQRAVDGGLANQAAANAGQQAGPWGVSGAQIQAMDALTRGRGMNYQQSLEAGSQRTARGGLNTAGLTQAAKMKGTQHELISDNMAGQGTQSGNTMNWGMDSGIQCCFIFLEALNGELPEYVYRGRAEFRTGKRVSGYRRMAWWLVPLMSDYPIVSKLVNTIIVKPFLRYGAWYYKVDGEPGRKWGRLCWPVCSFWLNVWNLTGKK